jgi:hypothetical protein
METPITQPVADEFRHWQVGDLFTLGVSTERKLVINVTDDRVGVIAESGFYSCYGHQPQITVNYKCTKMESTSSRPSKLVLM